MSITKEKIKSLKEKYDCNVFFETGLYHGVRFEYALECGFEKVVCIELLKKIVDYGKIKFKDEIQNKRAFIYNDDSANMSLYLENFIDDKILFWLDAHLDNGVHTASTLPISRCPVLHELESIKKLNKKPIILIDDIRCILNAEWGQDLSSVNIDLIIDKIKDINSEYKIEFIDGTIEKDILLAY